MTFSVKFSLYGSKEKILCIYLGYSTVLQTHLVDNPNKKNNYVPLSDKTMRDAMNKAEGDLYQIQKH